MNASITYDELKRSPLGKSDVEVEEVAVWLDMQKLNDAKGIKSLMNVIERNYCTKVDWNDLNFSFCSNGAITTTLNSLLANMRQERPSSVMLRNLFVFMFKTDSLSKKDNEQLLKFSKRKIDAIKSKQKKIAHRAIGKHYSLSLNNGAATRLNNLFEVYAEMYDKLNASLLTNAS